MPYVPGSLNNYIRNRPPDKIVYEDVPAAGKALYNALLEAGSEMTGIAPSQRFTETLKNRPKDIGINMETVNFISDMLNNTLGMIPGIGPDDASKALPMIAGLYRKTAPGEIKAGSNAFSALWDKQPRIEIPDNLAKINMPRVAQGGEGTDSLNLYYLREILDHPELYKQKPELAKMDVLLDPNMPVNTGSYFSKGSMSHPTDPERPFIKMNLGDDPKLAKSLAIHEVQHPLQAQGGLAKGSSPSSVKAIKDFNLHETDPALSWAYGEFNPMYRRLNKEASDYDKKLGEQWAKDFGEDKINKMIAELRDTNNKEGQYKAYLNTAGEFEARDAASRISLTPEQRITTPPYSSENIPLEDLIVRMESDKNLKKKKGN
jgi:hypothetical protein